MATGGWCSLLTIGGRGCGGARTRQGPEDPDNRLTFTVSRCLLKPEMFIRRLVVVKNIISDLAAFRIELGSIPNKPYFEKITATRDMDIKLAAQLADISLDEFKALNPAHNRPVINIHNSSQILIPVDKVRSFQREFKKLR